MLHQILADRVVGVVLLGAAVNVLGLGLHLEVRQERRAGDHDQTLAVKLLGRHDHEPLSAVEVVLGNAAESAVAVAVIVGGIGRVEAEDDRRDRFGHGRGRGARSIHRVDGRAAVLAVQLRIQVVMRILRVVLHARQEEGVEVVGAQIQPLRLSAVPGVVLRLIVADAQAGTERRQNLVLLGCHMILCREAGIALIEVAPAAQHHSAAVVVERRERGDLRVGIGVIRIAQRRTVAAARRGEDDGLVLLVGARGDQVFRAAQLHRAHGVARGQSAEVAHGIAIVTGHILVVVRSVDADVHELVRILHVKRHVHGEGIFLAVLLHDGRDRDGHDLRSVGRVLEGDLQRAVGRDRVALGVRAEHDGAVGGVGHGLHSRVRCLAVEQGRGQLQRLAGDGDGGAALHAGDAELEHFADPDGRGDRKVAVRLGYADVVVAVVRVERAGEVARGQRGGVVPRVGDLAGVDDHFDLADGVSRVGVGHLNADVQLVGNLGEAAAERQIVHGVGQLQVLVLGRVHAQRADRVIQALLGEIVGQDDVTGVVGVAPLALVVVLVVGGRNVPALVERHGVVLVAGVVAARADLALAVADLDHEDAAVDQRIPVGEVAERAEGGAGVVELAEGVRALRLAEQGVIGLHARVGGLVVERGVVAGDDAGGVEGVDVAGAAGPRHLKARERDHVGLAGVEVGRSLLVSVPEILAGFGGKAHVIERALRIRSAGLVKVVGVVGEGHEVHVCVLRQVRHIVQRGVQRAGAVGVGGVGVELAEVELILRLAHGEAPALARSLAVRARHGDGHAHAAVGHVLCRGVGHRAVLVDGLDLRAVHRHDDGRALARVGDFGGDHGLLLSAGLAAASRRHVGDDRLVLHGDCHRAGDGRALRIRAGHGDGQALAHDLGRGDDGGVRAVFHGVFQRLLTELHGQRALHAEHRVHGEGERIILSGVGVGRVEADGGQVHHAVGDGRAVRHGVEVEGIDGVIRDLAGIHAVGLVRAAVVFQPLAIAAVFCGAALQIKAAHAAVAVRHGPVGVLGGLHAVEGVVARAVRAQVAVVCGLEAVILAVFLHGEHACAVGGHGLAVRDLCSGVVDGGAFRIIVLTGQNALGGRVVEHDLSAVSGEIRRRILRHIISGCSHTELISRIVLGCGAVHIRNAALSNTVRERRALINIHGSGLVGNACVAAGLICAQRHIFNYDIFRNILVCALEHLCNSQFLCRERLLLRIEHLNGHIALLAGDLRNAAIDLQRAGDLHNVPQLV